MTSVRATRVIAGIWAMFPFLLLLMGATLWQAPERVPTHWTSDLPDGFSTGAGVFAVALSVAGFCAVGAALLTLLTAFLPAVLSRWLTTILAGVAATAAGTYAAAAWGTHLADGPEHVHVVWALAPFVVGPLWAWLAYLLYRPDPVDRQAVLDTVPERSRVVPVGAGDGAPWATLVTSSVLNGTAVFVGVVLTVTTVLAWWSSIWLGVATALFAVAMTLFVLAWSRVEVRVDRRGLAIRSTLALLPVHLLRVAAEDVVGVETRDLDPMKWGGIGLRWLPGRTAYIVRGGPGIVVHRVNGRVLGVEVSEGEEVAAAGARALLRSAGQVMSAGRSS
ncbi:hypothetical protein MWU75_01850 [Ornithinimicrobium sp. F0845]|uniref:hypothetical protein n=1 Tax=Ornithinimicrobium sp. F0845 TaxID=2926412 RepID=UPI001FF5C7BA|nr:hypothetical protein [Ornithinimicrobium sp. F0845]MCK0110887.1 hypothetical protein [Ornithinimicrobium sp. F0845]